MKLSKEYLMFAFHLVVQHFIKNLESYYNRQSFTDAELRDTFEEFAAALKNDALEIEGYERNEWVKLNPNDESTLPPESKEVLFLNNGRFYIGNHLSVEIIKLLGDENVFWRPLPKTPVESEDEQR